MSEEERRKRLSYRVIRKKWLTLQTVLLIAALVATVFTAMLAYTFDKTYYVNYNEKSSVNYGVHLKENDFYEDSFLGKDYAYIASLIDAVETTFDYSIVMENNRQVDFEYTYRVDSVVLIKDKSNGKILYAPVYNEVGETTNTAKSSAINIREVVKIDYDKYNAIAENFIKAYRLKSVDASVVLKMTVNVVGVSSDFETNESTESHVSSISVPLCAETFEIKITSDTPPSEQKILSYTTKDLSKRFTDVSLVCAIVTAVIAAVLWLYAYLSRNVDITYDIKIAKLVRNYKSFIQKLCNAFDTDGYQILLISSFDEMLEIRDTIQSPILMEENTDKTLTRFFIPTNTKLLYIHEIKVDDYDKIYGYNPAYVYLNEETQDKDEEQPVTEEAVISTAVVEEDVIFPAVVEETVNTDAIEEVEVVEEVEAIEELTADNASDMPENTASTEPEEASETNEEAESATFEFVDEKGNLLKIPCKRSFTANLIQSNQQVKSYYSEIKNKILSFIGTKARTSWRCESFNKGRQQLFKLKICGKTIYLYCALDPNEFERSKYFHEHVDAKAYAQVPMLVKIRSDRAFKKAIGLIDIVMNKHGILVSPNATTVDYVTQYPYDTTANLVERGLVKILLPDAIAAEPKPYHHIHKKLLTVEHDNIVEEITIFDKEVVTEEQILEVAEAPIVTLEQIDYDENSEPTDDSADETDNGVDVIGVVWPEKPHKNKIYRYDPDGETVEVGDTVIVPTTDSAKKREVIRRAVVAHGNHKILPEAITHPLKKILGIIRRKTD